MTTTSLVLLAAVIVAAAAFVFQRLNPRYVHARPPLAPARGRAGAGVLYAFTVAFAPTAKETASRHLLSYLGGIGYHLAIFTMLARLLISLFPVAPPPTLNAAVAVVLALGLVCGFALLGKRMADEALAGISVPDDFLANLVVDAALAAGIAASLAPRLVPVFQLVGALLLLYAPLGKLRHMLFLLSSRFHLGAYFGRRGVRPAVRALGGRRG